MLKYLINIPVQLLDKFLKFPVNPKFEQTRLVLRCYRVLHETYKIEVSQGIFGSLKTANGLRTTNAGTRVSNGDEDGNFKRLMSVSAKILSQLSERDKYYRAWLGLLALVAAEEIDKIPLSSEELLAEISVQWKEDLTFLSPKIIESHRGEFISVLLTQYLSNVSRIARKSMQ